MANETLTLPSYAWFLRDGYEHSYDMSVKTSSMDNGLKKQRPLRSKPLMNRKGTLLIKGKANLPKFWDFLNKTASGTQYFNYYDPITKTTERCRFIEPKWAFTLYAVDAYSCEVEMESVWSK